MAEEFLADNIHFVGTGEQEYADGREGMVRCPREDTREIPEPFRVDSSVLNERQLEENVYVMPAAFNLKNPVYAWHLCCFFVLKQQKGQWLIRDPSLLEPGNSQGKGKHYPQTLVMESIVGQQQELLSEAFVDGMLGYYVGDGFSFYFINRRMLEYLGYGDEKELTDVIHGQFTNCIHPENRAMVEQLMAEQLGTGEEYMVEYRMCKKDGSYIWVHGVGHKAVLEDDQPVIASVCSDTTAQKQAQKEISHIHNNTPGAVFRYRFDADFSVVDADDGLFGPIGCTRQEFTVMGNRMSATIWSENLAVMEGKLHSQLEHGNTIRNEDHLVRKDGSAKWISTKAQLFTGEGKEQYFYRVFVGITDEERVQERVKELYEDELTYFTELPAEDGLIQGRISVTRNYLEGYLLTAEVSIARVGDTYEQTIENPSVSTVDARYGQDILRVMCREKMLSDFTSDKTGYHFDFLRRGRDGGVFWSNISFRVCPGPGIGDITTFFYTFDITEKKLQEQLLYEIAELGCDIITEIDIHKGTYHPISFCGSQKVTMTRQEYFQGETRNMANRYMDQEAGSEYLEKMDSGYIRRQLTLHDMYNFIVEMRDEYGVQRIRRFKVFYINQDLRQVGMVRTDVTDVVRKEQRQKEDLAVALVTAGQASAAKSDFLSRMSHEIRTPMSAIIGMSTVTVRSIGDDEQVEDCISKTGISSRSLLSPINDILDMGRTKNGKMPLKSEKIPTDEFPNGINSICYVQAAARGVDYECILDLVLDDYYISDAMKLQQMLINIPNNAIRFTNEDGKVTLSAVLHRRTKNDVVLRFIVNDMGVGTSEEFLPHIFEPSSQESTGTTTSYRGTGLGLAIFKDIVGAMNGKITVRPIKGIGIEFTVDVKLGIMKEEKLRHNRKKTTYNFLHLKTLVMGDGVAVCESAIVTLEEMGVKTEWVNSGRRAVKCVGDLWIDGKYLDMAPIDWRMPEMDGIETARRIRGTVGPDVTITIMTVYDRVITEHEAKLAGMNLLMSEPMFRSSLISAFTRALGEEEEQGRQPESSKHDFTGRRVLLVKDNMVNMEVAVVLLEGKGSKVDTAEDGLRALELFSKSLEGYYDTVLMDIRIPLMDGLTTARNMRYLGNGDAGEIPIIAMIASTLDDDIGKSKTAGMDTYLAKPIKPDRLFQTLYDLIFGKEA